jgi:hypothetical protein
MGIPLWEMAGNFKQILEMDISGPEDGQALIELLDEAEDDIENKVLRIGYLIRTLETEVAAAREEEKRIAALRKVRENKIARLKEYAVFGMETAGLEKAEDAALRVSIANNPPSLQILDEADIPDEFWIEQDPVLNKSGLRDYVKANPGCSFAWLESTGKSLRIK